MQAVPHTRGRGFRCFCDSNFDAKQDHTGINEVDVSLLEDIDKYRDSLASSGAQERDGIGHIQVRVARLAFADRGARERCHAAQVAGYSPGSFVRAHRS